MANCLKRGAICICLNTYRFTDDGLCTAHRRGDARAISPRSNAAPARFGPCWLFPVEIAIGCDIKEENI